MLEFIGSVFLFIVKFIVIINVIAIYVLIGMFCLFILWLILGIMAIFNKKPHSGAGLDLGFGDGHGSSCGEDCPECMGVGVVDNDGDTDDGDDSSACPTCGGEGKIDSL